MNSLGKYGVIYWQFIGLPLCCLDGSAEWEGDHVEALDRSLQEMCWSKDEYARLEYSPPIEV